jgi:hypothetical protein
MSGGSVQNAQAALLDLEFEPRRQFLPQPRCREGRATWRCTSDIEVTRRPNRADGKVNEIPMIVRYLP